MNRRRVLNLFLGAALAGIAAAGQPVPISIDYPAGDSIFPPEITPPTFIWLDPSASTRWRITIVFRDGSAPMEADSRGERLRIGEIDPRCVAETNKLPKLTPRQAASRSWKPDTRTWDAIKSHSVEHPADITISGYGDGGGEPLSRGRVSIRTSRDPVGAPVFYRDVPLMPSELEKGVIKPLAPRAVPLIAWRLRNIAEPRSRVVLEGMSTCANCHSFSRDGKTLGMDLDGPQNDKSLYAITPVGSRTSIRNEDVITWNFYRDKRVKQARIGFMSQISPDGQYVVTTVQGAEYVANFKDYRFLQVFYQTRGVLAWYSRAAKEMKTLPGADDPRYVHSNAVWSPDGKYIVFSRAKSRDPYPEHGRMAQYANDPLEVPVQYDLYRIPFNGGKGGSPEPIRGASRNGMSNSFPKFSPDGRWIVFVQARNGLLMRPDSQLYIIPAEGGTPRRMRANTPLMNSWHSFSPNGRWMVFSSKARSPYTQMYLTHLDEEGNDSPAILIEDATAANRAVNIPEFVNIPPDGLLKIDVPAADFYRLFDRALDLAQKGQYDGSIAEWRKALAMNPDDAKAHNNFGVTLVRGRKPQEALEHFRRALELKPDYGEVHVNLGMALAVKGELDEAIRHYEKALELNSESVDARANLAHSLLEKGRFDDAIRHFRKVVDMNPESAEAHNGMGVALLRKRRLDEAIAAWRKAIELKPDLADAHYNLGNALYYLRGETAEPLAHWRAVLRAQPDNLAVLSQTAWVLSTSPDGAQRNGVEALSLARRALQLSGRREPAILDTLAAACAETGRFADALEAAREALEAANRQGNQALVKDLKGRISLYEAQRPFRVIQ